MKQVFTTILFFLLFDSITAQTKRALIVAIGNYVHWPKLSSLNDVDFIKATLTSQGFEKKNIKTITDSNATHTGITGAINNLVADSKSGDVVLIHFSTHGEQLEDNNGDETDGLDETIVTYNAVLPDDDGHFPDYNKDQEAYLRDDEFGALIEKLRKKLGKNGDVIVFMDLCHSGTITRANITVRGSKPPGVSSTFDPKKYPGTDTAVFKEKRVKSADENALATYVVFSAARAEERDAEIINRDNKPALQMGPLTYAISKVFATLDSGITYRSLFSKIQAIMDDVAQSQHGVLEGNGIDRQLFGGRYVFQRPYVEIDNLNGQEIRIKAGLLHGLDSGAKVAVYPYNTLDPAQGNALATGTVIKAGSYSATVSLDKDPGLQRPSLGRVFITEPVYTMKPVKIRFVKNAKSLPGGYMETEILDIKDRMKDMPLIQFNDDADLLIVEGKEKDSIIVASNGYLFDTVDDIPSNTDRFKERLQQYAQYKFLKGLPEVKDPDIKIEVKLIPVINGKADISTVDAKFVNGTYEYHIGDTVFVWVKNSGASPFYINILDLQPDGIINPVLPNIKINNPIPPEYLMVPAQSEHLFAGYFIRIAPPVGQEFFKIFASKNMIDVEDIASTRGVTKRGNLTFLEQLVKKSYDITTRGVITENISNANGSVFNLLFRIVPKQ